MNRFVSVALPIFGAAVLIAAAASHARSQSADLVLCDRLAADPSDVDKPADVKGVRTIEKADIQTAIKFCKVASGSSRRAMFQLGRAYAANGQMPEAIAVWRKAADKGSTAAMVELGSLSANGSGVPRDQDEARKLFEKAAAAGNPRAVANLAALSGTAGVGSDPAQTRAALAKGAEANSAEAQFQLGMMYAEGTGGVKDDVQARALFEKAAAQDHPQALEWYGSFLLSGRGGPADSTAAKANFEKAAALGNENAKEALKVLNCSWRIKDKKGNVVACF